MKKSYDNTILKIAFWGYITLFMLFGGLTYSDLLISEPYYPITAFILSIVCGCFFVKNLHKL